jgi:hypothetical protein
VLFRDNVARPEARRAQTSPGSEGAPGGSLHVDLGICSS